MWAAEFRSPPSDSSSKDWKPVYFHLLPIGRALGWLASVALLPVTHCRIRNEQTGEIITQEMIKER